MYVYVFKLIGDTSPQYILICITLCVFMVKLPTKEFQELVPKLREKDFYKSSSQRKICWSEYNLSQIEDSVESLMFIKEAVDSCGSIDLSGRVGKPLTNPKSLAKAILLCEFMGLPERHAQGWLKILGSFLGIKEILDDWVIGEAYDRLEVLHILKQVFENTKTSDGILSGDGTGIETSRKQNYESTKKSNAYMTSIVDSREIVQAFDISGKQECQAMHELIKDVKGDSLRLDAGFVDRKLVKLINKLKMTPYIFPKKNLILNAKGNPGWTKMYLNLLDDVQEWLKEYHQRSHTESFHSSFKRKNNTLTKRNYTAQLSQITARIIIHNQRRTSYFNRLAQAN